MGKCILAGHPPAGGQIGYGTYTGDGEASKFINLGVTPKWVLVLCQGIHSGDLGSSSSVWGGLATQAQPVEFHANVATSCDVISIVQGGFQVFQYQGGGAFGARANTCYSFYNYIYGT